MHLQRNVRRTGRIAVCFVQYSLDMIYITIISIACWNPHVFHSVSQSVRPAITHLVLFFFVSVFVILLWKYWNSKWVSMYICTVFKKRIHYVLKCIRREFKTLFTFYTLSVLFNISLGFITDISHTFFIFRSLPTVGLLRICAFL
jgi:hypothetical protein